MVWIELVPASSRVRRHAWSWCLQAAESEGTHGVGACKQQHGMAHMSRGTPRAHARLGRADRWLGQLVSHPAHAPPAEHAACSTMLPQLVAPRSMMRSSPLAQQRLFPSSTLQKGQTASPRSMMRSSSPVLRCRWKLRSMPSTWEKVSSDARLCNGWWRNRQMGTREKGHVGAQAQHVRTVVQRCAPALMRACA